MLQGVRREMLMIQERRSKSLRRCLGRSRTSLDPHGGGGAGASGLEVLVTGRGARAFCCSYFPN